jgi:hypothetical protein
LRDLPEPQAPGASGAARATHATRQPRRVGSTAPLRVPPSSVDQFLQADGVGHLDLAVAHEEQAIGLEL